VNFTPPPNIDPLQRPRPGGLAAITLGGDSDVDADADPHGTSDVDGGDRISHIRDATPPATPPADPPADPPAEDTGQRSARENSARNAASPRQPRERRHNQRYRGNAVHNAA